VVCVCIPFFIFGKSTPKYLKLFKCRALAAVFFLYLPMVAGDDYENCKYLKKSLKHFKNPIAYFNFVARSSKPGNGPVFQI
jgi:hypothetical protein